MNDNGSISMTQATATRLTVQELLQHTTQDPPEPPPAAPLNGQDPCRLVTLADIEKIVSETRWLWNGCILFNVN